MNVRIRGIYATALTQQFLSAGHDIVDASPPIQRRFDATFESGPVDVSVCTSKNRQGVGVTGTDTAVTQASAQLQDLGRDTLGWEDPTPPGAVFDGRVTGTLGGGAVVELGPREGYLPYDRSDGYINEGNLVRVQVRESAPSWADHRPELGTELHAPAGIVTLEPGEGTTVRGGDSAAARELAGMTELLDFEPPAGWRIQWERAATDATLDTLREALDRATDRVDAVESAVSDAPADPAPAAGSQPLVAPMRCRWLWFGRESRFALDDIRADVTTTMPGHHRTKAAASAASSGVDLVEALSDPSGEFPFTIVADQFGPQEGDLVSLEHGKPDGRLITLGTGRITNREGDELTLEREMTAGGSYDALGTPRESGDTAVTRLEEGRWWYPTTYRSAGGETKGTYVNICTPVECFPEGIRYVDLHVDVIKYPDGTVERVDDDELNAAVTAGHVSDPLAEKARNVARAIERAL